MGKGPLAYWDPEVFFVMRSQTRLKIILQDASWRFLQDLSKKLMLSM